MTLSLQSLRPLTILLIVGCVKQEQLIFHDHSCRRRYQVAFERSWHLFLEFYCDSSTIQNCLHLHEHCESCIYVSSYNINTVE